MSEADTQLFKRKRCNGLWNYCLRRPPLEGLSVRLEYLFKETQRNWIGKSVGAAIFFDMDGHHGQIEVFSTRPDTFWRHDCDLAPEHELVQEITTADQREAVAAYQAKVRTQRETEWRIPKPLAVVSLEPMPYTLLVGQRCLFGLGITSWLVTEQGQLWPFQVMIAVIMPSQNTLT